MTTATSKPINDILLDYLQGAAPLTLRGYFNELRILLREISPSSDFVVYVLAPEGKHQSQPPAPRYVVGTQACGFEGLEAGLDRHDRFVTRGAIDADRQSGTECLSIGLLVDERYIEAALLITITKSAAVLMENRERIRKAIRSRLLVAIHAIRNSYRSTIVSISLKSKDLNSFLFKAIHDLIVPRFNVEGASIFYADEDQRQLILGASTGIKDVLEGKTKRSDIRYFADSESYTARCFRSKEIIVEDLTDQTPLHANTHAEAVGPLYSRIYMPLMVYSQSAKKEDNDGICGVVRLVNVNLSMGHKPMDVLELSLLSYVVETAAFLAKRYVRAMNIVHDQERATHGYITDLTTIKLANEVVTTHANTIRLAIQSAGSNLSEDLRKKLLTSTNGLLFTARNIASMQEYMTEQLNGVLETQENYMRVKGTEAGFCATPYTSVFLRIVNIRSGISKLFNRQDILITSQGDDVLETHLRPLPPLRIETSSLFSIVRNIVENAIKYSQEGSVPKIDITWQASKSGASLSMNFRDFGIGIDTKEEWRLFSEGFRSREARRLQLRGNGIGLYLSREKARKVGAELEFRRPADDQLGSIFVLTLPIYRG